MSKTQFGAYVAERKLLFNYAGVLELLLRYIHIYVAHTYIYFTYIYSIVEYIYSILHTCEI